MNKDQGGGVIRTTLFTDKSYLVPYHDQENPRTVKVREEQTLVYKSETNLQHVPFHIRPEKREARWHGDETPLADKKVVPREKPKDELVKELMWTEYGTAEGINISAKKIFRDLQKMEGNLGIYAKKMMTHRKRSGWDNKGKGLLQVLYDRGWIDESGFTKYKMQVVDEDR